MDHKKVDRREFTKLLAAAAGGLGVGAVMAGCSSGGKSDSSMPMAKHACKGMNSCKGQGGCQSGDAGCAGKNSCKGKGGCATTEKHACKGMNACKGQGGCSTGKNGCAGKNACKGQGGCEVPIRKK